ncbi:MAG: hypothetical protein HQL03_09950 [Nitrospirae bacterium]|nr:hypothetical protein [Nitrospirota bacterium]
MISTVWPVRSIRDGNLTVLRSGTGYGTVTSSDGKIDCGNGNTCTAAYTTAASVTLTATAASGSIFAGWSGDCPGTSSTCTVTITGNKTATATFNSPTLNKAIIVAGGGPFQGNNLWESTKNNANKAYKVFIAQGFDPSNIYYLSDEKDNSYVDADPTNANLQYALTNWATDAKDVIVFMFDHGGTGRFKMRESEILYAVLLRDWLNTMQDKISGIVVVIYDACDSGSFLPYLTPPQGKTRIVITSTKQGEEATSVYDGVISFSGFFWGQVNAGAKLYDAFKFSINGISFSQFHQTPQLDDNGNGIGNEDTDGDIAETYNIGKGIATGADIPVVGSVSDPQTLNATPSALLWANITSSVNLRNVWAVIRPPDFNTGSTSEPVTDMPNIELTYNTSNKRYEGTYNKFTEKGTYEIAVFAMDEDNSVSLPKTTTVTQTVSTSTNPIAGITANGSHNDLYIYTTDTLRIDVKLTAGGKIGANAQWWLYAYTNFGTLYYNLSAGWLPGYTATYQGALFDLSTMPVLSYAGLPAGNYLFVFKVKTTDGESYSDSVLVNISNK